MTDMGYTGEDSEALLYFGSGAGLLEADNGRENWEPLLSAVLEWLVRQMATMVVCRQMYTTRRDWHECYLRHGCVARDDYTYSLELMWPISCLNGLGV